MKKIRTTKDTTNYNPKFDNSSLASRKKINIDPLFVIGHNTEEEAIVELREVIRWLKWSTDSLENLAAKLKRGDKLTNLKDTSLALLKNTNIFFQRLGNIERIQNDAEYQNALKKIELLNKRKRK